jgi:hypothetical protein
MAHHAGPGICRRNPASAVRNPLTFDHPHPAVPVSVTAAPRVYKGFTLTARTFQVRGSGLWTLDVTIGRRGSLRAFSSDETFANERDATVACWRMACRIIDANPPDCLVGDLSVK